MSSFKNIAVPPRSPTRKRSGDPPDQPRQAYMPATSVGMAPRSSQLNKVHRFAVGQRLSMAPGGREVSRGASACIVVFLLPYEGGALRYRVRSDNETYERIVDEADLKPIENGLE
jgi:hypothetical protein